MLMMTAMLLKTAIFEDADDVEDGDDSRNNCPWLWTERPTSDDIPHGHRFRHGVRRSDDASVNAAGDCAEKHTRPGTESSQNS